MIIELITLFNFLLSMLAFSYIIYSLLKKKYNFQFMEEHFDEAIVKNEQKAHRAIELYLNSMRIELERVIDEFNHKSTNNLRDMEQVLTNLRNKQEAMNRTMNELMSINKAQSQELRKKSSLISKYKKKQERMQAQAKEGE